MAAKLFGMRRIQQFSPIDATDRSKISSDQKRFFIALSLYPLSFFANTPFKGILLHQELPRPILSQNNQSAARDVSQAKNWSTHGYVKLLITRKSNFTVFLR